MTTTSLRSEFAQKIRRLIDASTEATAYGHPGGGNMGTNIGVTFKIRHGIGPSLHSERLNLFLVLDEIHSWSEEWFKNLSRLKWVAYPTSKHPLERLGELA